MVAMHHSEAEQNGCCMPNGISPPPPFLLMCIIRYAGRYLASRPLLWGDETITVIQGWAVTVKLLYTTYFLKISVIIRNTFAPNQKKQLPEKRGRTLFLMAVHFNWLHSTRCFLFYYLPSVWTCKMIREQAEEHRFIRIDLEENILN